MMPDKNNDVMTHVSDAPFPAYKGLKQYIFVSYAHIDAEKVFPDLIKFRDNGFNVWYDQGIEVGNEWTEEIEEALIKCKLFVVFISENSVESENVRNEINLAIAEHKIIVPIYLEDAKLRHGLRLSIGSLQGILKHSMAEHQYDSKVTNTIKNKLKALGEESGDDSKKFKVQKPKEESSIKTSNSKNFKFLEELLSSDDTEIKLDYDIIFDKTEEEKYSEGILIERDNIVLDGNNHVIDAETFTRIFKVTGKKVQLKNIIFKNGFASNPTGKKHENGGGAIFIEDNASLYISHCKFVSNYSESDGGALYNKGKIEKIYKCDFEENSSETSGGAIATFNHVMISRTQFKNNESKNGGCIYNSSNSSVNITNCKFIENKSSFGAGGIYNYGELRIDDNSVFKKNTSYLGGALLNYGYSEIIGTTFKNNTSANGGAIFNINENKLKNYAYYSSNFENEGGSIELIECNFASNTAEEFGGAICNLSKCKLHDCAIGNNSATQIGNIICNGPENIIKNSDDNEFKKNYWSIVNLSKCDLRIKSALEDNAIYNQRNCLLKISNDTTINNKYPDINSNIFCNQGDIEFN